MRSLDNFCQTLGWPIIFMGLNTVTHESVISAMIVFILVFRAEISIVIRSRRLKVKLPGFEGTVEDSEPDSSS